MESSFSVTTLWVLLALVVGAWLSMSWILNYHWKTYGHHTSVVSRARIIYFIGSLILIVASALLIATV